MTASKVLFAYATSSSAPIIKRLKTSNAHQYDVGWVTSSTSKLDRVLFIDVDPSLLDSELLGAFKHVVRVKPPFIASSYSTRNYFCLSLLRNDTIQFAIDEGYDWIVFCDADTVVVNQQFGLPETGYGTPKVYYQKSSAESMSFSVNRVLSGDSSVFAAANSWFIVRRDLFSNMRFNDAYYGYGFEDRDFDLRVRAAGFNYSASSLIIVHSFHSDEQRNIDWKLHNRNRLLFEMAQALLKCGYKPRQMPKISLLFEKKGGRGRVFGLVHGTETALLLSDRSIWRRLDDFQFGLPSADGSVTYVERVFVETIEEKDDI